VTTLTKRNGRRTPEILGTQREFKSPNIHSEVQTLTVENSCESENLVYLMSCGGIYYEGLVGFTEVSLGYSGAERKDSFEIAQLVQGRS